MKAPVGRDAIFELYGDPTPLVGEDGHVSSIWEARMVPVRLPGPLPLGWDENVFARSVRVHQTIDDVVRETFDALVVHWSSLRTYDGGYVWRTQRGSSKKLSMHSFGAALDFNAATNRQGSPGNMHPSIVAVFEAHGWTWGGRFRESRVDPMHFQFGSGY